MPEPGLRRPARHKEPRFLRCAAGLEDELIRALGAAAVGQVIAATAELRSWRAFRRAARAQEPERWPAASPAHGHPVRPEEPVRASWP